MQGAPGRVSEHGPATSSPAGLYFASNSVLIYVSDHIAMEDACQRPSRTRTKKLTALNDVAVTTAARAREAVLALCLLALFFEVGCADDMFAWLSC